MAAADQVCGIDCETEDSNAHAGLKAFNNATRHVFDHRRMVMTGFSLYPNGADSAYYVNLAHADVENRLPNEIVRELLALKPEGVLWIAHNAPFELVAFKQCLDIDLTDIVCSLQMAVSAHGPDEYDLATFASTPLTGLRRIVPDILRTFAGWDGQKELNADQQFVLGQFIGKESEAAHSYNGFVKSIAWGYSLKRLSKSLFGVDQTTYEQVIAGREHMGQLTGDQVCAYGADDAYWCVRVYFALLERMLRENPSALVCFLENENPMIHVYADVWRQGLRINKKEVYAQRDQERANYAQVLRELKASVRKLLPFPTEPNAGLMEWQSWYQKHWQNKRREIEAWANSPDSDDDLTQCRQLRNPIGNAWSIERGMLEPAGLNLSHYYAMRVLLHDLLGHKLVRIGGEITTDKDARARMALSFTDPNKLAVLRLITRLTTIEQAMKLYLTPYTQLVDPETDCLYSVLSSMLASRRLGTRFPNPMQLAKRGESTYVRGFYIGDRDDHLVVSADWSSIELVEIGEFSGDPEFAKVFGQLPYGDLHSGAAVDCLKVDPRYEWLTEEEFINDLKRGRNPMNRTLLDFNGKEMEPDKWVKFMRTEVGKTSNFGFWYSGALSTLAEKLGWNSETHWAAVEQYRKRFAVAESWRMSLINEVKSNGFITLPDGHRRVRYEATDQWQNQMFRKFNDVCPDPVMQRFAQLAVPRISRRANNQTVNSMIQGMCAALAKASILAIRKRMDTKYARFMVSIHDELLFSVHRDYVPEFIPILREGMCSHPRYIKKLPLSVNVAIGRTFKPYDRANPAFSQIELDEAPVIENVIPVDFEGKSVPQDLYPQIVNWMMAA